MKKVIDMLADIRPEFDFSESQSFIEDGYLDSFDLVSLVSAIDKEYGISIKGTDIVPEHFANLDTIAKMLDGYGVKGAV